MAARSPTLAMTSSHDRDASAHPTPEGCTIYYWSSGLLMLAPTLVVERPSNPLGATLRIACGEPYLIEVDGEEIRTRASLLGPKAGRRRVEARRSDIAVFYLALDAPEHLELKARLGEQALLNLDLACFARLLPDLRRALSGRLSGDEPQRLLARAVECITGHPPSARERDARIVRAMRLLDELPLDQVSLEKLSGQLHLSPSRLRELFKAETGSTIGDYARWQAVWRVVSQWRQGLAFTDVAQDAGFHDSAHFSHAFVEMFGINPQTAVDPEYVQLIRCD